MDPLLAAQALALLALVLATYRYARLVRRRALARRQLREREDAGLRGGSALRLLRVAYWQLTRRLRLDSDRVEHRLQLVQVCLRRVGVSMR